MVSGKGLYLSHFQYGCVLISVSSYVQNSSDICSKVKRLEFVFIYKLVIIFSESSLSNLEDMLVTLPAGDLRSLAKSLRLSTSEQRPAIIEAVQKHAKQKSIGAFFSGKCAGTNEVSVMKRSG